MAGLTYSTYVQQIATMAVVSATDPNFTIIIPSMIDYAELRIQRDLDFLSTQYFGGGTYQSTAGNSFVTIPINNFVTIQTFLISPPLEFSYKPILPVGREYIQNVYGYNSTTKLGIPEFFAIEGSNTILGENPSSWRISLGPTPDDAYLINVTGTIRFTSLSASNPETYISTYFPDMFIMASMIYISAYQRNFGRLNDDPQMAQTYESQYQALKSSALIEENRKKFQSSAWTSYSPSPIATPTRG